MAKEISSTTQGYLDIYDITHNMVILKDGSCSLAINVSAMNFGLLSEMEQDAIIYSYAGLLNSINFPIQILIQSHTKDATAYLNSLKESEKQAANEERGQQIHRYRQFIAEMIYERNVLDKKFYIVINASALEIGLLPTSSVLPWMKPPSIETVEKNLIIQKAKDILDPKRDHLISQFSKIGLTANQVITEDLIKIFYINYNFDSADGVKIVDSSHYSSAMVGANIIKNPLNE